ncbi:MAG TPA: molybdenum cofactor biosynthesis protein MoaE [Terracidiphilus sp.]|jgi:molybdopterin synthase catalytic subunit
MQVRVIPFGILKESLGSDPFALDLPGGTTVADLISRLGVQAPLVENLGIAVSINAEYAGRSQVLSENDEVGLLPPVSGGSTAHAADSREEGVGAPVKIMLTRDVIDADALVSASKQGEDGAVVVFDGIVRNNSRGRQTLYLDYEAYEEMAFKQMTELAGEAINRFGVRHVTMVHRLGRLQVGETSVLIILASAHRAQAYEASRWLIDTLKKTVPIWKKETFTDGAVWADGEPFPPGYAGEGGDGPAS